MSKYACVDVGGTFTDAAVVDENGNVNVFKSPTTPQDWTEGILGALRVASEHYEEPFDAFLKDISVVNAGLFTHGSTIATNAVVEKKCGKVGILCTEGFRESSCSAKGRTRTRSICSSTTQSRSCRAT